MSLPLMLATHLFPVIVSTLVLSSFNGSLFAEAHNWISETDLFSDELKVAKFFYIRKSGDSRIVCVKVQLSTCIQGQIVDKQDEE